MCDTFDGFYGRSSCRSFRRIFIAKGDPFGGPNHVFLQEHLRALHDDSTQWNTKTRLEITGRFRWLETQRDFAAGFPESSRCGFADGRLVRSPTRDANGMEVDPSGIPVVVRSHFAREPKIDIDSDLRSGTPETIYTFEQGAKAVAPSTHGGNLYRMCFHTRSHSRLSTSRTAREIMIAAHPRRAWLPGDPTLTFGGVELT